MKNFNLFLFSWEGLVYFFYFFLCVFALMKDQEISNPQMSSSAKNWQRKIINLVFSKYLRISSGLT